MSVKVEHLLERLTLFIQEKCHNVDILQANLPITSAKLTLINREKATLLLVASFLEVQTLTRYMLYR